MKLTINCLLIERKHWWMKVKNQSHLYHSSQWQPCHHQTCLNPQPPAQKYPISSASVIQKYQNQASETKDRQNDKTFSQSNSSKAMTSLLAYTGDNHIAQETKPDTSDKSRDTTKYKRQPLYPLPHKSDNRGTMIKYKLHPLYPLPHTYLPHYLHLPTSF